MEKSSVYGYVRSDTHGKFEHYWGNLGLTSASALVCLLIAREIELKRLRALGSQAGNEPRISKVSAYVPEPHAARFKEHAARLDRSTSDCVAELVEREIDEQWLYAALRHPPAVDVL